MPPSALAQALSGIENEDIIQNIIKDILANKDRASLEKIYTNLKESPDTEKIAQELADMKKN